MYYILTIPSPNIENNFETVCSPCYAFDNASVGLTQFNLFSYIVLFELKLPVCWNSTGRNYTITTVSTSITLISLSVCRVSVGL